MDSQASALMGRLTKSNLIKGQKERQNESVDLTPKPITPQKY